MSFTYPIASGGSNETGKNTVASEHGDDVPTTDRGTSPFDEDSSGADAASLDPIHVSKTKDKSCGTPTIYGYEDYTGVSFHPSKESNPLAHLGWAITVSTELKSKEYGSVGKVKSNAANFGGATMASKDSLAEPAVANYLTFDVTVSVTKILSGHTAYIGDPKTDRIFATG